MKLLPYSECIQYLKNAQAALCSLEKRIMTGDEQAILNRLHSISQDRFDNHPDTVFNCDCDEGTNQGFSAFPKSQDGVLICCIDCGTIWRRTRLGKNEFSQEKQ